MRLNDGRALAVIAQAFRHICSELGADLIELRKVRADALVAPVLKAAGLPVVAAEEAPFADLAKAGTWANFEQRFHAKAVKNRRRHLRRFEERGCVAFTELSGGNSAADAALACMTYKRAWLSTKGLVSRAFADTRIDAFFADAARGDIRPIDTKLSIVTSAGEFADIGIAITAKHHRALHIIAYNLKFERYGAGALNLEAGLKRAMADGVATFDFMAPRHDYKMEWADGVVLVEDYAVGLTRAGRIYTRVGLDLVKNGVKSALKVMPPRLQGLIADVHRRARSRLA